jgi:hypothetical protein
MVVSATETPESWSTRHTERVSSTCRPPLVDCLHDFFRPSHSICDGADRCGHSFTSIELSQFAGREDTRCDQQHTFPALVHLRSLLLSRFVRHYRHRCEITGEKFSAGLLNH